MSAVEEGAFFIDKLNNKVSRKSLSALIDQISTLSNNAKKVVKVTQALQKLVEKDLVEETADDFFNLFKNQFEKIKDRYNEENYKNFYDFLLGIMNITIYKVKDYISLWAFYIKVIPGLRSDDTFKFCESCKPVEAMINSMSKIRESKTPENDELEKLRESYLDQIFLILREKFIFTWCRVPVKAIIKKATETRNFYSEPLSEKLVRYNAEIVEIANKPEKRSNPWLKEDNRNLPHPAKSAKFLF